MVIYMYLYIYFNLGNVKTPQISVDCSVAMSQAL